MRHLNIPIFDDFVLAGATVRTSDDLLALLGQFDVLCFHVVAEQRVGTSTGTLTAALEMSGDAVHWTSKPNLSFSPSNAIPAPASVMSAFASDAGTVPNLALVRLAMTPSVDVHIRVYCTLRDEQ